MRKIFSVSIFVCLSLAIVANLVHAKDIKFGFVFIDRFPEEARQLGFDPGDVVQVGAMVKVSDTPIALATATNLDSGLVLSLASRNIGSIYKDVLLNNYPFPKFDPGKHLGVWQIKVKYEDGHESIANTHRLDKTAKLPYVTDIKASGNRLAPEITWSAPDQNQYPSECKLKYKVRLLKSNSDQFYATKKGSSETRDQIPQGVIKPDDIADTYVRIETQCWDTDDKGQPVPVELKSETFIPLSEVLRR